MKLKSKALAVGAVTAFAGILSPATALATGTCYSFGQSTNGGTSAVLRYIPMSLGSINTDAEARNFKHLKQEAYILMGKLTAVFDDPCTTTSSTDCVETSDNPPKVRLMTTFNGEIITGRRLTADTLDEPGAHMGITVHFLRKSPDANGIGEFSVGLVALECVSTQAVASPDTWQCTNRTESDHEIDFPPFFLQLATHEDIILKRVNAARTPGCSVFENELQPAPP